METLVNDKSRHLANRHLSSPPSIEKKTSRIPSEYQIISEGALETIRRERFVIRKAFSSSVDSQRVGLHFESRCPRTVQRRRYHTLSWVEELRTESRRS